MHKIFIVTSLAKCSKWWRSQKERHCKVDKVIKRDIKEVEYKFEIWEGPTWNWAQIDGVCHILEHLLYQYCSKRQRYFPAIQAGAFYPMIREFPVIVVKGLQLFPDTRIWEQSKRLMLIIYWIQFVNRITLSLEATMRNSLMLSWDTEDHEWQL